MPFDLAAFGLRHSSARRPRSDVECGRWRPDGLFGGGLLAYLRGDAKTPRFPVVWVDGQGGVTPLLDEAGTYGNPRLSPDGKRLSLTVLRNGNWDIWVFDIERHVLSRLTFDEATDTEQIGRLTAVNLLRSDRGGKTTGLYRKPSDGLGEEQLLAHSDSSMWPTTWSPDGRFIAFSANRKTFDVGVVTSRQARISVARRQPVPRGRPGLLARRPMAGLLLERVRPATNLCAAASVGCGRWQIRTPAAGSRGGRATVARSSTAPTKASWGPPSRSAATASGPASPDRCSPGRSGGINGINIAGNAFADYDVSADGKRFVMFPKSDEGAAAEAGLVTLVTGWFDEVTRTAKP